MNQKGDFSLNGALKASEKDKGFLINSGVFSKDLFSSWVKTLRKESYDILTRPLQIETERYLDCKYNLYQIYKATYLSIGGFSKVYPENNTIKVVGFFYTNAPIHVQTIML